MNYHVAFDASQNISQLAIWALGPVFASLFLLVGWALNNSEDRQMASKGKLFMLLAGCGLAFSLLFLLSESAKYYQARKALKSGNYQIAEGTVRSFVPMPPGGHSTESFSIGNTDFRYGSGWGAIVFNSDWNRGYIREGAEVRITHKGEDILRVEVK